MSRGQQVALSVPGDMGGRRGHAMFNMHIACQKDFSHGNSTYFLQPTAIPIGVVTQELSDRD